MWGRLTTVSRAVMQLPVTIFAGRYTNGATRKCHRLNIASGDGTRASATACNADGRDLNIIKRGSPLHGISREIEFVFV